MAGALQDGKITSREFKPIIDHILDREGMYEQKVDVSETVDAARLNLRQLLDDLNYSA